jgi:hypothetical protein
MTIIETLQGWRSEIGSELAGCEAELAQAIKAVPVAERAAAAAAAAWQDLRNRIGAKLRKNEAVAGAVVMRLAEVEKREKDQAAGALIRARQNVEILSERAALLRQALDQLGRTLGPAIEVVQLPARVSTAPLQQPERAGLDDVIEFPHRLSAAER